MRFSIDTNVLVDAAVRQGGPKHRMAIDLMRRAAGLDCIVTLQALGELFRTLTAKFKVPVQDAIATVHEWRAAMRGGTMTGASG